ncbi:ATP-dependent DNA helicase Q5, partial [Clarias magur]
KANVQRIMRLRSKTQASKEPCRISAPGLVMMEYTVNYSVITLYFSLNVQLDTLT